MNRKRINSRTNPTPRKQTFLRVISPKGKGLKRYRNVATNPVTGFSNADRNLSSKIVTGLFILLVFHIITVFSIVLHSKFNKNLLQNKRQGISAGAYQHYKKEQKGLPRISESESYTWVNPGDTYQSIARRLNFNVAELKKLNKNEPIQTGTAIKTPVRKIKVISPDTRKIGKTPQIEIHKVVPSVEHVIVSQIRNKKPVKPIRTKTLHHKFKSGETLWSLSRKYEVSVKAIQRLNPNLKPTAIHAGTTIIIPRN